MKIQLGISTNFAIKRWADPEDWVRVVVQELGLRLIQFSFDQFDPRSAPDIAAAYGYRVRNACEKYGARIHSTFTGLSIYSHNLLFHPLPEGRRDGADWFEKSFALTRELGAGAIGGPYGGMDLKTFNDPNRYGKAKELAEEALVELLWRAETYGITRFYWEQTPLLREGPVGIVQTLEHLEKINRMRKGRGAEFALCLDVGHAISPDASGDDRDPYAWLERLASHAPMIHLQQTDGRYDRHWPFTAAFNSDGIIHADKVLESLCKSSDGDSVLFIEVVHPFEEKDSRVLQDMIETVAYWRDALDARFRSEQGGWVG